jgi:hypothetical protein
MLGRRPIRVLPRPKPNLKRPKQRRSVTVCIAALTLDTRIVTVSDTMVSTFMSSADATVVKMQSFAKNWEAMWSADDLTQCIPIIDLAAKYFQNRANTLQVARSCLKRAYQKHLSELAADSVLGRFQMDMDEFKKSGKRRFTETQFNSLSDEIRKVEGVWHFLACGFDSKKKPHLFTVEEPGKDAVYDSIGFCAIGSGKYAAESLLFQLQQSAICAVPKTLINLLCAKFAAEKVGAGRNTYVFIMEPGSSMCSLPTWVEPTVRAAWESQIQPKVPDDLLRQVTAAEITLR